MKELNLGLIGLTCASFILVALNLMELFSGIFVLLDMTDQVNAPRRIGLSDIKVPGTSNMTLFRCGGGVIALIALGCIIKMLRTGRLQQNTDLLTREHTPFSYWMSIAALSQLIILSGLGMML